jgi:transposase
MDHHSVAYVGFDTSKTKHAVAVAEGGREGEVRYLGEIEATPAAVEESIQNRGVLMELG